MIEYRAAEDTDAEAMAAIQATLFAADINSRCNDVDGVREAYFDPINGIACTVAVRAGQVIGFQSVRKVWEGNSYGVTPGWAVIGTHIHPDSARLGIGRHLFTYSLAEARAAGIETLDATIASTNKAALAYYRAMGFVPYRDLGKAIQHRFDIQPHNKPS